MGEKDNILLQMTEEKKRKIHEAMALFLGYEPSEADKREFQLVHRLGESHLYYRGMMVAFIKNEIPDNDPEY